MPIEAQPNLFSLFAFIAVTFIFIYAFLSVMRAYQGVTDKTYFRIYTLIMSLLYFSCLCFILLMHLKLFFYHT